MNHASAARRLSLFACDLGQPGDLVLATEGRRAPLGQRAGSGRRDDPGRRSPPWTRPGAPARTGRASAAGGTEPRRPRGRPRPATCRRGAPAGRRRPRARSRSPAHTASAASREQPAGEDGEPLEHAALVVEEQVVAPLDDRAEGLLPRERGAGAARQQAEPIVEPGRELLHRDDPVRGRPPARWRAGARRAGCRGPRRGRHARASTRTRRTRPRGQRTARRHRRARAAGPARSSPRPARGPRGSWPGSAPGALHEQVLHDPGRPRSMTCSQLSITRRVGPVGEVLDDAGDRLERDRPRGRQPGTVGTPMADRHRVDDRRRIAERRQLRRGTRPAPTPAAPAPARAASCRRRPGRRS